MNIPNRLSLLRIIFVPIMMFFYLATFIPGGKFVAAGIFILAAFTDFLDGKIARKYNLITNLGKFLDSVADKLLVTVALILICCDGTIPAPYGAIILAISVARDFAMNMLRQIGSANGVIIAADKFGKYKAVTQFIAIPFIIVYAGLRLFEINATFLTVFMWIGYAILIISTIPAVLSLINYIVKNRQIFKETK